MIDWIAKVPGRMGLRPKLEGEGGSSIVSILGNANITDSRMILWWAYEKIGSFQKSGALNTDPKHLDPSCKDPKTGPLSVSHFPNKRTSQFIDNSYEDQLEFGLISPPNPFNEARFCLQTETQQSPRPRVLQTYFEAMLVNKR